ncbi:hypothetical protein T492DRAFT_508838 [Pavlovales sp. CCMP2436]|nr:hypothetical protein T492DRAFT_508838 [Pavlovales sp. CCMP2436]
MQLRYSQNVTRRDWADFAVLKSALTAFIRANGTAGLMPLAREFRAAGRGDIVHAMHMHHFGMISVAAKLGLRQGAKRPLDCRAEPKPNGYWKVCV